ncbi:MAG: hypothetical protein HFE91_07795 [Acutalibacter sp.]|jgi:hypothetical protein|uniref:hypothetical protein n=1 Tax=unclassified Acutalibacter TaxID=2620728 RepID=UPI00216E3049|nr:MULTISPECIES: hypothetical protein [unclassified Acutalibacter]MCI9225356.1 hypothetical protein [Acutalibacter sp.]
MSELELYRAYLTWLGGSEPLPPWRMFDFPLSNSDIHEDDSRVVNRLVYLVPDLSGRAPRCFFFFEENVFSKDRLGDLVLERPSLRTFGIPG